MIDFSIKNLDIFNSMKPRLVFFFFANESPGGIEMLWVRLAKALQQEYDVFVLDDCKTSIFRKLLKDDKVSFLDFSFKGTTLPDDAVVIAPLNYPNLAGCFNGKNLRFLFWSLYEKSALCVETYRWLHLFENKFQINFSRKTEKLFMKLMNPVLYKHLRAFYQIANEKQALIYMAKDNIIFDEDYFDIKLKENIIPLGLEMKSPVEFNLNPNYIRACWLGRFVGFKYNAIKNVIVGLHDFCQKYPEITVHLDLIGYGDFENQIKQDCLNYTCSNFIPEIKGKMIGDTLQTYLQNNVDLLCAHGTAILEGAKYGIPSLVFSHGYHFSKVNWLFNFGYGQIGSMVDNSGISVVDAMNQFLAKNKSIGKKCYEHFCENFTIETCKSLLIKNTQLTQLRVEDLRKMNLSKHIFWARMIEWYRNVHFIYKIAGAIE